MTEKNNTTAIYRKDYQPCNFLIDEVHLEFELHSDATRVTNRMRLRINPCVESAATDLVLNGEELQLIAVYLDQRLLTPDEYQHTDQALILHHLPDTFELQIETICNPKANTALNGLYLSNDIFCTQCEPHGFRKITYYLDRPDVMAKFTTTILADPKKYPILLSNGNCISSQLLENRLQKVVWQDPFKKPCYLFALVAGKLDCLEDFFITQSQKKVQLKIFVESGNQNKAKHAMDMLKQAMRWDEKNYGREYDLDIFMIVAVADFNMGAMENKGLNIFNAKYILADADTATDADYEGIATVVAHEYFHNWTGNRITCRDWFQLSLKEGLTVYRDHQFTAELTSKVVANIDATRKLKTIQFAEDSGPLAHPVRPDSYLEMNNFYTATVYEKGAQLIGMLHTFEGEAGYRKGMDLYFDRFDGMAVTCDDFIQAHADANQRDYQQFLRWYSQAGTPELCFSDDYDPISKKYSLHVTQKTAETADSSAKEPFHLPIKVALFDLNTAEKYQEHTLELQQAQQSFVFDSLPKHPTPSLMRSFSAPTRWSYPYTLKQKIFLLQHDDDYFNRFEISQQLFHHFFTDEQLILPDEYLTALELILVDPTIEPSIKARLLTIPSYRECCEQQKIIYVEKTIQLRKHLCQQISLKLSASAYKILLAIQQQQSPYLFNAESTGMRSLAMTCLRILFEANHPQATDLAKMQYSQANNMTDRFNATYCLALYGSKQPREQILADFHEKFKNNALVLEKWLALEAMVPQQDTLAIVQQLMQHADFEIKNPNKVRALIGTFSQQNFVGFHLSDGSAYEFLAEQIINLDKINPQIAARLVEPLTRFRHYEDAHLVLMRSSLQRIALVKNLSPDLYEIVHKSV